MHTQKYDEGQPGSSQATNLILSATAFNVTSVEEFKTQFSVVPLQYSSLQSLGLTAEQAQLKKDCKSIPYKISINS